MFYTDLTCLVVQVIPEQAGETQDLQQRHFTNKARLVIGTALSLTNLSKQQLHQFRPYKLSSSAGLTCRRLNMLHPCSVIAHHIDMLQAGQQLDFPEDLQQHPTQNHFIGYSRCVYILTQHWSISNTDTHLHAIILWDFFDENLLHSITLSIQFVHNLQNDVKHNMIAWLVLSLEEWLIEWSKIGTIP